MADSLLRQIFSNAYQRQDYEEKQRQDKTKEVLQYLPTLADRGYTPDEINKFANDYIRGEFKLPTERTSTKMIPPPQGQEGPSDRRTSTEPIAFEQSQTALVNPYTGQSVYVKGKGSNVKTFGEDPTKAKKGLSGGDPNSMDTDNLRAIMNTYSRMLETEIPGTPEYDSIRSEMSPYQDEMRARLNRSSVQKTGKAGTTKKTPNPGKSYQNADEVKAAYRAGTISKEAATAILQKDFGMK